MVKVYGASDDLVEIEGSIYKENEIGCYNQDVIIKFCDGTVIKIGYPKKDKAVWFIDVENAGGAYKELHYCNNEDDEIYSDILEIDAEIVSHHLTNRKVDNIGT